MKIEIIKDVFPRNFADVDILCYWALLEHTGKVRLNDFQADMFGNDALSAVTQWAKRVGINKDSHDFYILHSPEWPDNPQRKLFILQSGHGFNIDTTTMIHSLHLLANKLNHYMPSARVWVSWPFEMAATKRVFEWLEVEFGRQYKIDSEWVFYTPEQYYSHKDAAEWINKIAGTPDGWRILWEEEQLSPTESGVRWQASLVRAYTQMKNLGYSDEQAYEYAYGIARNSVNDW